MIPRWTDEQVAAITSTEDTLLAASAGTGKTTTVVGKILWALGLDVGRARTGGPLPPCPAPVSFEEIVAITFTEKAAHDLAAKLREEVEAADPGGELLWELERATVGTIHGFAAELLRDHALRLGIDPAFRILDPRETEIQQTEIVREVLATSLRERDPGAMALTRRYGLTGWTMSPGAVGRVLEVVRDLRWRARQFDAWSVEREDARYTRALDMDGLRERARFAGAWSDDPELEACDEDALELADALYRLGRASVGAWLAWLERENARDFDSLILDARRLLTRPGTAEAREAIRERTRLLVIDEFQDTDRAQWDIARALAGPASSGRRRPQLFLVGDPKQSIYRFRGADIDVWNEAREALDERGRSLELSWNFRSEPALVGMVNRIGARALEQTAVPLARRRPESVVRYRPLRGARAPTVAAGLEWLVLDGGGRAHRRREEEARRVAARIAELLGSAPVVDPDTGGMRACAAGDFAVLGRRNDDLSALEPALRSYGIPFYNTATSGLADRQEVLDLVTAVRLIDDRFDDLRAFAFLRSPFVGLRDEVLARIGLHRPAGTGPGPASFLERAEAFLEAVEAGDERWFPAPESPEIVPAERAALREGLAALREAQRTADRVDAAEVLQRLLDRTGYRLHLSIREGAAESLANIERFLALLDEYRHLSLGQFLDLWERWGEKDLGLQQARLHARGDEVVTLSTIHAAKGLEWPVVVLIGTDAPIAGSRRYVGTHWADAELGPVLLPRTADRGPRAELALERRIEQELAEEARLFYVAATRARDRLVVAAPAGETSPSFAAWLADDLDRARETHLARAEPEGTGRLEDERREPRVAEADDTVTGTGGQLDAFGFDPAARRQLDLFGARAGADAAAEPPEFVAIRRGGGAVQTSFRPPPVTLAWLRDLETEAGPEAIGEIVCTPFRAVGSATERMLREADGAAWQLRYRHGVLPPEAYLPEPAGGDGLPARLRGTVIHGVLERIEAADELARVLEETIASLDLADLESALVPGSRYRLALEREIADVVKSPHWRWYVEGEHHRELGFVYRSPRGWVRGSFDLYRPAPGKPASQQGSLFDAPSGDARDPGAWVIDFKTHRTGASEIAGIARSYREQVELYREAAAALATRAGGGPAPRIALHFTHPNVALEV